MSRNSSHVAGEVYLRLKLHCNTQQLAWVFPEGTSYRCFADEPGQVRRPDTSVILRSRMTAEEYNEDGHCPTVPDLVVEVISPTDVADKVEEKIGEWLAAGVRLLWEVYPNTRVVRAYQPNRPIVMYRGSDILPGEPVVPAFRCTVDEFFQIPTGE